MVSIAPVALIGPLATETLSRGSVTSATLRGGTPAPTPTPTPTPALLALTRRVAIGGNSWEAQGSNIDFVALAWMRAGCRGWPSIGMRQARGGDRLSHLVDRAAPMASVRAGLYLVMNPINDFSDAAVTNDNAGGDVALARLDAFTGAMRAVVPDCRFIVGDAVAVPGITSKATARARYRAGLASRDAADAAYAVFDPNAAGVVAGVDLSLTAESTDATHPNKTVSVLKLAKNLGAAWAAQFVADDVFAAGLSLPGNLVSFNPATAWTVTANSSGLAVAQAQDVLRDRPAVACRRLNVTGTAALAETTTGTTPDLRLRVSLTLPANFSTDSRTPGTIFLIEISNAAGGAPVGLATMQLNDGVNQAFQKQHSATDGGYLWDEGYRGPIGIIPSGQWSGQTGSVSFDITLRGKQGVAADIEVRVAAINLIDIEATAYGPPACMSRAFTIGDGTNRQPLRAIPTTTPASTVATGGTIAKNVGGQFVGGGLTHSFDAMRAGVTDVGDILPARSGQAAVPYTTVAGDTGQGIAMRHSASNAQGSDSVNSNLVSVT